MEHTISGIFPIPVYHVKRNSNLDESEWKDIKDIIDTGGMMKNPGISNHISKNTYIFDTKLANLKEFCEKHIKTYVKEIINPKEELDFYITQSWLNVIEPAGMHHPHRHANSIIAGVFYVSTVENDKIDFHDPLKSFSSVSVDIASEVNTWNMKICSMKVITNLLVLFPPWLEHGVELNPDATKDRISIAFNVFAKGTLGAVENIDELFL